MPSTSSRRRREILALSPARSHVVEILGIAWRVRVWTADEWRREPTPPPDAIALDSPTGEAGGFVHYEAVLPEPRVLDERGREAPSRSAARGASERTARILRIASSTPT